MDRPTTLDHNQSKCLARGLPDDPTSSACRNSDRGLWRSFWWLKWIRRSFLLCRRVINQIKNISFLSGWRPCQTQVSKKNITDWGIFQSLAKASLTGVIRWKAVAVDQTTVLPAPTPGKAAPPSSSNFQLCLKAFYVSFSTSLIFTKNSFRLLSKFNDTSSHLLLKVE